MNLQPRTNHEIKSTFQSLRQKQKILKNLDSGDAKDELEKLNSTIDYYISVARKFDKGYLLENNKDDLSEQGQFTLKDLAAKFNQKF